MTSTCLSVPAVAARRQRPAGERRLATYGTMAVVVLALALHNNGTAQTSPHGDLKIPCEDCHTAQAWNEVARPTKFDHASTGFPLKGQHALVRCRSCHPSFKFKGTESQCAGCHDDLHRGELGAQCVRCHTPESWLVPDMAQRHSGTAFPLVGAHLRADCQACHPNQQKHQYVGVRTDCHGCHAAEYEGSQSPNHRAAGFGTDCSQCHAVNAARWGGGFDHARTGFALMGAHATTPCSRCHAGNNFRNAGTQCISCHQQQFTAAASPKHTGFSTDCLSCHSMNAWRPASFDHNKTAFRLTGAHLAVSCSQCHANGVFAGTPTQCVSCHEPTYANTTNPRHSPGISVECSSCHTTTGWRPSSFDHNKTNLPLTGAHPSLLCNQCHINGIYTGTPAQCSGCHLAKATAVVSPSHTGFSTDCAACHTTTAWRPSTFDHNKSTFQLTGAHLAVACNQCHKNGVYAGTPTTCGSSACHLQDYTNATNPRHGTGFSTDCASCHTTTAWQPASFDHSRTSFPLTGAHLTTPCALCHPNGVYTGTPNTCGNAACHLTQYNATTSPSHAAAAFPLNCQTCHTTTAWKPSTWNHDPYFPISAGSRHAPGRWNACADCHTVPTNYAAFSCIDCHAHSTQSIVDGRHRDVSGYSYTSAACYRCHPQGTAGGR